MIPKIAVTRLAEIMAGMTELSEVKVLEELHNANFPRDIARLAFRFTQFAWGRLFLNGMNLNFSDQYWILDPEGNLIESGLLMDNPYYTAALEISQKYVGTPEFMHVALTSSVVQTIKAALNNGSKPENLLLTPDTIFVRNPSNEAMTKFQKLMSDYVEAELKKRRS